MLSSLSFHRGPFGVVLALACWSILSPLSAASASLTLNEERHSEDDLLLTGRFAGVPDGASRYVARAQLLQLTGRKTLREKAAPGMAVGELTVVPLSSLLAAVPLAGDADAIILRCGDRWESLLPREFIAQYDPYLLLLFDGRTPAEGWPRFSRVEALAPYYANVSSQDHPGFDGVIDTGMISATQIVEIRAVNQKNHYAPFFAGAWSNLSSAAIEGRKTFIRHCNNCHQGPGGVGGNTSQRPLVILQTHATHNEDFFRRMVRRPKDFFPDTVMPPHEKFDEATFTHLIAFLRETLPLSLGSPTAPANPLPSDGRMTNAATPPDGANTGIVPVYAKINSARTLLSAAEVESALKSLPGWELAEGKLRKTFVRKNFPDAIAFLQAIVPLCEQLDHHPEIFTVYNKVNLALVTFDAGNRISTFDVKLATQIEAMLAAANSAPAVRPE